MNKTREMNFAPAGPITKAFMESESFIRGLMGPIGSGKSTACALELLRRSSYQRPSPDGIRRTRWCVIRNSYPELKSTTIKTWADWCPLEYGKTNFDSPIIHHVKYGDLDMEVLFLALDRPEDAKKLLSLELTGAWVNEAREVPKAIIDALTGRVGRYPAMNKGGASWSGIIMDTNPPDNESWWYKMCEEVQPEGWEFFKQPSGLSAEAENIANLPPNYYKKAVPGKDPDWVKVYVHGEYGFLIEGKPVYPMFRDRTHVAESVLYPAEGFPLLVGADFGMTPCAIIGQRMADGRWIIIDEFITEDYGMKRFGEELAVYMENNYPGFEIAKGIGDPSGDYRSPNSDDTCLDILKETTGWKWEPAPSNDLSMRLEVVKNTLNRMVDGDPGFLMSPKCKTLRKGFAGSYHYKLVIGGDGTRTHHTPEKNKFSHPHDGLQYLILGGGEAASVMNKEASKEKRYNNNPRLLAQMERIKNKTKYNPFKHDIGKVKGF